MKASPVGQPYLGLGGDVATTVGEINFTDPAAIPKQIGDALGKVGTSTDNFLKTNADLIEGDQLQKLRDEMRRRVGPMDDLTEQLAKVKGTTASLERSVTARGKPIEAQWDTEREAELTWFKTELANVEAKLKAPPGPVPSTDTPEQQEAERARLEAERKRLEERLGAAEAATLTQQRAVLSREVELYSERVAAAKADAKLEAATKDAERVKSLTADRDKLEAFRVRSDQIDEELRAAKREDKDLKDREATRKAASQDTLKRLRTMSSGISTLGQAVATLGTPATTADADVQAFAQVLSSRRSATSTAAACCVISNRWPRTSPRRWTCSRWPNSGSPRTSPTSRATWSRRTGSAGSANHWTARSTSAPSGTCRTCKTRARDLMRWSMYNLVMSYRYEYLSDVENTFFNYDLVIERLKQLEATRPDRTRRHRHPADGNRGEGHRRRRDPRRVHRRGQEDPRGAPAPRRGLDAERRHAAPVRRPARANSGTSGQVTFNLVRDMHAGTFDWVDARIVDITLGDVHDRDDQPGAQRPSGLPALRRVGHPRS